MENIITYTKPIPVLKKVFGLIFFLFAFYIIVFENFLMGCFIMSIGIYLASTTGSQYNLDTKQYRTIWSIFAIHFGKWKPSPDFEYISVFRGREKQRVTSISATTTFTDQVFLINLFYDRNKRITFFRTYEKEKAFEVARHFRMALEIDIVDATEREQRWVPENK